MSKNAKPKFTVVFRTDSDRTRISRMSSITVLGSLRRLPVFTLQSSLCGLHRRINRRVLSTPPKQHGLWEPDDLKLEPDIPEFKAIHIRMRGYDYPTLESFAKHVHRTVSVIFNLESDAWASPAKCTQVQTFHPQSTAVSQKYDLRTFERTVSAENVPSPTVPILVQFVQKNCPQGVEVSVKEPDPHEEESRYVPDYDILELKAQKDAISTSKTKK